MVVTGVNTVCIMFGLIRLNWCQKSVMQHSFEFDKLTNVFLESTISPQFENRLLHLGQNP
jgi:hypothetical protein